MPQRADNPTAPRRQGVAVIVVVLIVITAIVAALQLYFFSRNVYRNTARSSFGTTAEYLAEAACEEGFWILQTECNSPDSPLYKIFRQSPLDRFDEPYEFTPGRLFTRITAPENAETFKPYPPGRIETSMLIRFQREPFHPRETLERSGEVLITAIVKPQWGRGEETYRRVEVRKPFRVQLTGPPRPFDRSALTLFKPDYINGASKQALDNDIVQPTNKAIVDTNNLNKGYDDTIKQAKQKIKWTDCQALAYIGSGASFMKMSISGGAKIPADFFKNESILIGNPDRNPLEKLSDFNYEDILREMYPPLKKIFDTIYTVSNINLQVLKITSMILAVVPGKAESTATLFAAPAIAAIHQALEVIVVAQCVLGQISVVALKVILEFVIIGQHTEALRQAARGNFEPALGGIQTAVSDVQANKDIEKMDAQGGKMENVGNTAKDQNFGDSVKPKDAGGGSSGSGSGGSSSGSGSGGSSSGSSSGGGGSGASEADLTKELGGKLGNLNGTGGAMNFNSTMSMIKDTMGRGEFSKAGPLDKFGTDSDTSKINGLIKGFVKGHRDYFSTELVPGGDLYGNFVRDATLFYEEYYLKRAGFVLKDQDAFDAFVKRHEQGGINGIVFVGEPGAGSSGGSGATTPLIVRLGDFHGRAVVYATGGIQVEQSKLKDPATDILTLVTPGSLTLPSSPVEGAFCAVPRSESEQGEGGALTLPGDASITGSLFLRRYTVSDNKRTESHSVKGSLAFNKNITANGPDGIRASHLWVTFSPVERTREVFLK